MSRSIFLNETGLLPDLVGMEIDYSTSTNASEFSTQFQCLQKTFYGIHAASLMELNL